MLREIAQLPRKGYRLVKRILLPSLHKPEYSVDYIFLGSEYGGWPVVRGSLTTSSCVYSFGVGDDISFDLATIKTFGASVKAFDPTPRCVEWVSQAQTPHQFSFFPIGLSDKTQLLRFSAPPNAAHMSYTIGSRKASTEIVELPVKALDEILAEQGDAGRKIDLLKMDIEGSEYDALPDMIAKGILPTQLCVEFHHGMFGYSNAHTNAAVDALRDAGYKLYFVSKAGREYAFCR